MEDNARCYVVTLPSGEQIMVRSEEEPDAKTVESLVGVLAELILSSRNVLNDIEGIEKFVEPHTMDSFLIDASRELEEYAHHTQRLRDLMWAVDMEEEDAD